MKVSRNIFLLVLSSALVIGVPATRFALAADKNKDTEIAKHMESMNDNLKKLRKSIKSASENAASLDLLSKIEADTVASKALVPAKAATVPEAEKAKFLAGYRKDMAALLQHLCKIEVAIVDNDNAKAEALFKDIKKIEDDGHEKYSDQ